MNFERLSRVLSGPGLGTAAIGWVAALIMMIWLFAEILLRLIIRKPIPGTIEIVSHYFMVGLVFLPLAFTQKRREHIMVLLFTMRLPWRVNQVLDLVWYIVGFLYAASIAWFSWHAGVEARAVGEYQPGVINVLIWPARFIVPLGTLALAIQYLSDIVRGVQALATGVPQVLPSPLPEEPV